MQRSLVVLAALAASCAAPPAAPPVLVVPAPMAAPEAPAPRATFAPAPGPILGTIWSGSGSDGRDFIFEFRDAGVLHYTSPTGTFDNGRWIQNGRHVSWDMNDHYADYEGTIEGTTMKGRAWNKAGLKWTWTVEKQP
jgi:hypothetical protein